MSNVSGTTERMIALQESPTHYFQRPDASYISVDSSATSLTGYSGRLMLNKNRGRWTFNSAVGFISPEFEVNDLGFGSYSDYINAHVFTGYRWLEPTDFYQYFGINAAAYSSYDFGGNNTVLGYRLGTYLATPDYYGGNSPGSMCSWTRGRAPTPGKGCIPGNSSGMVSAGCQPE